LTDTIETRVVYVDEMGMPAAWWGLCKEEALDDPVWRPFALDEKGDVYSPAFLPLPGSQMLFLECPVFEALYHGNRGPGKTITLLMDFARDVGKGYGSSWRGILFRRHFKDLDDVVKKMEEFFPKMFPGWKFLRSKSEYMAMWPTGEALLIRHIRDEDDYADYHGHEYPWQGWEELTQWPDDKVFKLMQSCCRSAQPGIPSRVRATTNPSGIGHSWVKKRYDLPQSDGQVLKLPGQMPRVAIRGSLRENFLLLSIQPHYEIIIQNAAKNPAQAKAWIEGDWNVTSGGMFDDLWDHKYHVIPSISVSDIPHSWTITRAYDHGQSHPFSVGWWLESSGEGIIVDGVTIGNVRGDLILWMEWYGTTGEENTGIRMAASKIAQGILDREDDAGVRGRVLDGPADTEIYTKVATGTGRGPSDDMEDVGVTWERADKSRGSRKRGWEKLRTLMSNAIPGKDGTRELPGLFICKNNKHWLELAPSVPRSEADQDEIPANYEDHCLHPDTLVPTSEGVFPIKKLVGKSDKVMTVDGWMPYYGARLTRKDTEMVEITFSDGSTLVCTPDHKIMTGLGGMVGASCSVGRCLYGIDRRVVRVKPVESSDSYCLTVPSHGHFMLSNGVFVSNCLDMTRYRATWEVMGMFRKGF